MRGNLHWARAVYMDEGAHGWHFYRHSGLLVRSQLALPEWDAFVGKGQRRNADVTISLEKPATGPIDELLPNGERDAVTFSVADTARWRIANGREVSIEPVKDAEKRALRLFTLGSAWGALGYQRGLAMLHGSAVTIGDGAVLFGGTQEQGKSTMAAAMLARGARLVSDDLARVDAGGPGQALIHRSSARVKLWQAVIDRFGLQDKVIARDLFREEKFHIHAAAHFGIDPVALEAIVLLEWGDAVSMEALSGGEAVSAVLRGTCYRPEILEVMDRAGEQAAEVSRIVASAKVFRLVRPRDFERIDEACSLVEERLGD